MFVLAALIRRDEIKAPGHLLDREYTSAIFARAFYFMNNDQVEDWRRDIAVTAKDQQPVLEPPLVEYLVSLIYRAMGREEIYFARYLTGAFWIIGGAFLFLLARRMLSTGEALVATAYYLFVPMGIIISRSFQPDSLMMMMFLMGLYALVLYFEKPSSQRLLAAAVITSLTLLFRPLVIFAIFSAFLALSIDRSKSWKKIINLPLVLFTVASLVPFVVYYGYGILFAGFMRWKITTSFMPYLLTKVEFWLGWLNNVLNIAEFTPLLLAMVGLLVMREKTVKYLVVGLTIGFILFSVAFTYHIHTHPYYHIQLFPIVALALAPGTKRILQSVSQPGGKYWMVPVTAMLLLSFYSVYQEVHSSLYQVHMEDPALAREIGEVIHHSPRTVFIASYYGLPLEYYGEFAGAPWPVRIEDPFYRHPEETERSVQQRLNDLGFFPDYFVITNFDLYYRKHQDLQKYLDRECSTRLQNTGYIIYTGCQTIAFR